MIHQELISMVDYIPGIICVLQKMKKTAEDYLGTSVTEAVVTVPAYFK